ncbi:hypothetical protein BJF84_27325 [Rhodococcus sp. CUA-806]|jgi:hypothetical protein|nr:hypothetical protein BJF84_27325 [Rhodococcus sp. CUA-806]
MIPATSQPGSTSETAQDTGVFLAASALIVSAELRTRGRTHRWNIARPAAADDSGFLGRAFRHLDDAAVL